MTLLEENGSSMILSWLQLAEGKGMFSALRPCCQPVIFYQSWDQNSPSPDQLAGPGSLNMFPGINHW